MHPSKIWFCTDSHFGHEKIKEYCGRPDNFEEIIFNGLNAIPEKDSLVHLGDICMGKDREMHDKYIIPLKCFKILIRGNHDKKSASWYLNNGWDRVLDELVLVTPSGKQVLFTHQPRPDTSGYSFNVHGHFHNKQFRIEQLPFPYTEKYILLALENHAYLPWTFEDIVSLTKV